MEQSNVHKLEAGIEEAIAEVNGQVRAETPTVPTLAADDASDGKGSGHRL
jgi:hypothetical protein